MKSPIPRFWQVATSSTSEIVMAAMELGLQGKNWESFNLTFSVSFFFFAYLFGATVGQSAIRYLDQVAFLPPES